MRPTPSVLDLVSRRLALRGGRRGLIGIERVLAAVRVVLVLSSLLLVQVRPGEFAPYSDWVYAFLVLYLAHAIAIAGVLQLRSDISKRFSVVVHAADILFPAIISLFAGGLNSTFFLYFIFALLGAAFRWGMRETFVTTVAVVVTMAADAIAITKTPLSQVIAQPFDATHFVMRAIYLVIFAFLIGYISEAERRRTAEALSISQVCSAVRVESGLKGTVQNVFEELLQLFGSRELLILNREFDADRFI